MRYIMVGGPHHGKTLNRFGWEPERRTVEVVISRPQHIDQMGLLDCEAVETWTTTYVLEEVRHGRDGHGVKYYRYQDLDDEESGAMLFRLLVKTTTNHLPDHLA